MPKLLSSCSDEELISEIKRRLKKRKKEESEQIKLEQNRVDLSIKVRSKRRNTDGSINCRSCGILFGKQPNGKTEYIDGWINDWPYCKKNDCYEKAIQTQSSINLKN
jgi:hypothetical protein